MDQMTLMTMMKVQKKKEKMRSQEPKPSKSDDESPVRPEVICLSATANGSQFLGFEREEILYTAV